jgi:hypothetical protein
MPPEMRKTVIRIVAGIITVAAWSFVGFSLHGGMGPRFDAASYEASGRLMAQQALALLEPGGEITVLARDTTTFKNPASDIQLDSFRKTIERAHATIGDVHKLQVDPLRPIAVPSIDFCQAIRNTPQGGVVVSFMGPPMLTDVDRSRLGDIQPAIVAFCSGNLPQLVNLRSLFKQGLLQAAVVDRLGLEQPEQSFLTLTATNLAELSAWQGPEHK